MTADQLRQISANAVRFGVGCRRVLRQLRRTRQLFPRRCMGSDIGAGYDDPHVQLYCGRLFEPRVRGDLRSCVPLSEKRPDPRRNAR
eukprot:1847679-Rhodomonas_salina.3